MWKNTFSNISHLFSICVCVCVCVALQEASGKVAGTLAGVCPNSLQFTCRWNFLQITEVKPAGSDKEKRKTSLVPRLICNISGANSFSKLKQMTGVTAVRLKAGRHSISIIQFRQLESLLPLSSSFVGLMFTASQ